MKFTFAKAPEGFDEHIRRSIRGYDDLISDVLTYSNYFIEDYTSVYDLGCSTGKLLSKMKQGQANENVNYIGIERETDFKFEPGVHVETSDIRDVHYVNASLITSIFTLQFIPIRDRENLIDRIKEGLNIGGAFIFAEKIRMKDSKLHEMQIFNSYDFKRKHFTEKEILDKEQQLRNIMKPLTHEEILKEFSGWSCIETFWQSGLFTGYIAIK